MNHRSPLCAAFLAAVLLIPLPSPAKAAADNVPLDGSEWQVSPQAEVTGTGEQLSMPGYAEGKWVKATVPGTVFEAYVNAGIEKDPNYADNAYQVDKKKYDRDYWYRTEFKTPLSPAARKTWLNFYGVNRDADIFLNGKKLGATHGFVERGRFDVTALLAASGAVNALAVLDHVPRDDGKAHNQNASSPAFICSRGWDWMPPVPGLNMGIHRSVYLSYTGNVSLVDPWIRTELPTLSEGDVSLQVDVRNESAGAVSGVLKGVIAPGEIVFSQPVSLAPNETKTVKLDDATVAGLKIKNPKLWWPNGYGEPNLYTCKLDFEADGGVSDSKTVTFGIKKYTYDASKKILNFYVNGVRVFAKGGDWGMAEYLLRSRGKDYDTRLRLHKEMHFNMIRNWMGMTADDAFYDACDRAGMMVWDEFWLDSSGRVPTDADIYRANTIEKIKQVRNHACIAIWCGENEGVPAGPLNDWLRADIQTYDAGDRRYQPNSHSGDLSGSGPWGNLDIKQYYSRMPASGGGERGIDYGMRSEVGMATAVTYDSFKKFMPPDAAWPPDSMWNRHFLGSSAGNARPDDYNFSISQRYGSPSGIEDYCRKAQLLNVETMKAMYEGWLDHSDKTAAGILIWMSQSAYPSFVWQTYDYYFDTTGSYWGARAACEPVHIYWNQFDDRIRVVNTSGRDVPGLTADIAIYNSDGARKFHQSMPVTSKADAVVDCLPLKYPEGLTPVHFVKLQLKDAQGALVSDNLYWRGTAYEDFHALHDLPPVKLAVSTTTATLNGTETMQADITDPADSKTVAFAIRPKLVKTGTDAQILPVFMNDGYFTLLPGETKHLTLEFAQSDAGGAAPALAVECWNNYPKPAPAVNPANLAFGKPITASSAGGGKAEYANDGDTFTGWSSARRNGQEWLQIDLGDTKQIGRVRLAWDQRTFAKSYEVQVSDDANTWTDIYRTNAGKGHIENLTGLKGGGRYIRLNATDSSSKQKDYHLLEFEAFAD